MSILSLIQGVVRKKVGGDELDKELGKYFEASAKYRSAARKAAVILILDSSQDLFEAIRFIVEKCKFEMVVMHVGTSALAHQVVADYGASNIKAILASVDFVDSGFVEWIKERGNIPVFVSRCPEGDECKMPENYPVLIKGKAKIGDYVEVLGFPDEYKTYIEDVPNYNAQVV